MISWLRIRFHQSLERRAEHLAGRLAPHLPPRGSVLDVGSGTGHNAEALRRATGGECREVDVVDFHIVGPGPTLFDGARLPLADGAVDVCVLAFVLNYAAEPSTLLREAGRVASRGVLVLQSTCPDRASRAAFGVRNWLQGRAAFALCRALGLIPPARLPSQARRRVDRAELAGLAAAAGLVVRHVEPEVGFGGISRDLLILDHPAPIPRVEPPMPSGPPSVAISVIIPARNEVALIAATVRSAVAACAGFRATGGPRVVAEVIVVDNASTDGTAEVLAGFASVGLRVVACAALGAARARTVGARAARGSVLVFLDADTHLPPGALRRFAELCGPAGFEAGIVRLGALDGGWRARAWWAWWNAVRRLPLARAKAMPACMFCTRAAFTEFGPFDVRVAIGEEWPILAGLYRARRERFIYDQSTTALSSGRRMELQPFGYTRTLARYAGAILCFRGRVHYSDHVRHRPPAAPRDDLPERDARPATS